jgi:hypothetical protein
LNRRERPLVGLQIFTALVYAALGVMKIVMFDNVSADQKPRI